MNRVLEDGKEQESDLTRLGARHFQKISNVQWDEKTGQRWRLSKSLVTYRREGGKANVNIVQDNSTSATCYC